MALQIPITGIPSNFRTPGAYAEILFAQGPASAAAGVRDVVIVMPKTSAGTGTVNTLYPCPNALTAEQLAGPGSPAHRAARRFLSINKDAKLFLLLYSETSGGSPAAATAELTLTTTSTGTGTLSVWVAGELCEYTFPSGTSVSDIGDGITAVINSKTWLPCTASNNAGVVTLTAKIVGASQGTATLGVIRVRAEITSGVGTTAAFGGAWLGTDQAGAEGSTTEAANLATALQVLDSTRKYYIAVSEHSATGLGNLKAHIVTKSEPKRGLRSVGIAGYTGAFSGAATLANGLNYERIQIACQPNSEHDVAEIVGEIAAVRQKEEGVDTAFNFDGYRLTLQPAYSAADRPDADDISDALNDGVTPIASNESGSYIAMSVNTRSKNSAGTVDDFRAAETHRISVCDEFTDEELREFALNFSSKKLADDELLADGRFNPNQTQISKVVRPSSFRQHILQRLDNFEVAGKLQSVAASKESLRVVKTGSRLEVGLDLHVIDHLHQATYRLAEVSSG